MNEVFMDPRVIVMGLMIYAFMIAVLMVTVFPIVFWFFVIPKIERRLGKKLKFSSRTYGFFWPIGKYMMGYVEIAFTISLMYLCWKLFGSKEKVKFDKERALVDANYDIEMASHYELVVSFISFSLIMLSLLSFLLMFLIPIMFPIK